MSVNNILADTVAGMKASLQAENTAIRLNLNAYKIAGDIGASVTQAKWAVALNNLTIYFAVYEPSLIW